MKDEGVDLFLKSNDPTPEGGGKYYAQTVILINLALVKLIRVLVITSYGVGVSSSIFGINGLPGFLLALLDPESNRP